MKLYEVKNGDKLFLTSYVEANTDKEALIKYISNTKELIKVLSVEYLCPLKDIIK